ncbi:hypothetical protein F7725_023169 [Dissostichus mawsoni]|uniref:Myb/SANT-like DNA-binding domain-containing protein n=1 Tax=Dissostichus mawsoni TaxID=36200 RepID=A0A7J5YZX8_DISMA|nr:hypothetical protein F7725_023169 [Dissostichus mawsoni]
MKLSFYAALWTEAQTRALVKHRTENEHLFTGKRCTAKKAWGEVLQKMGLEELLTPTQLSNKWDNLKRQYKELKTLPTGTGTDEGEATAATWSWFPLMHEAIGSLPSMEPPVLMDSCVRENEPTADVAPVELALHPVELGPLLVARQLRKRRILGSLAQSPPAKKNRPSRGALLEFLKEEAKREQERFEATQANTKTFLDLFEKLFNWVHTWSREQPCQPVTFST